MNKTISLSQIERINVSDYDIWVYRFDVPIKEDIVTIEVYGTIDDDNIRTSGPSVINGVEMSSVFGINVLDEDDEVIDEIDDIDIIDCD